MAVRIRLSRVGKKHTPFFRLVAVDSRVKRDGKVLANLGTYDGLNGRIIQFHEDLLKQWLSQGALLTESAQRIVKLYKKSGIYAAPTKPIIMRRIKSAEDSGIEKAEVESNSAEG